VTDGQVRLRDGTAVVVQGGAPAAGPAASTASAAEGLSR